MKHAIHASIHSLLQQQNIVSLVPDQNIGTSPGRFLKAGLLPFMRRAQAIDYFVMKPRAKHSDLPPPEFQLCKGTRMQFCDGFGWRDMEEGAPPEPLCEMLVETALREGMEELGVELANISSLFDMGPYSFASASTGKPKQTWMFACEIIEPSDFTAPAETTAERGWMSAGIFAEHGRADRRPIILDIDRRLRERFKL